LDIGGWFIPYPRATHVVDIMPWETRTGRVPLPECAFQPIVITDSRPS
jgi:hypothetical protein